MIAVGSWRGIGTTTSALLIAAAAAARGDDAWFVEADAAGGVLASRAPDLAGCNSLGRVAFESGSETARRALEGSARRLGRVSVLTAPWDSFQAWSAVASPRTPWVDALRRLDGTVVVDVGSLRGGSVPGWWIVERADVLVMVTSPEPASLTSTVAWMDRRDSRRPVWPVSRWTPLAFWSSTRRSCRVSGSSLRSVASWVGAWSGGGRGNRRSSTICTGVARWTIVRYDALHSSGRRCRRSAIFSVSILRRSCHDGWSRGHRAGGAGAPDSP